MIGVAATALAARASTFGEVMRVGPRPRLIRGRPAKVDFGHGLLIPMSRDAFHVLWEGDDRWITYGHGFGRYEARAMEQAEVAAEGTMKLMLITLAYAPQRLRRVTGGGWRLKSGNVADLVKGDIWLPGRPLLPTIDRLGFNPDDAQEARADAGAANRVHGSIHATTGWLLWKKDVTLDYVRRHARLLAAGNG